MVSSAGLVFSGVTVFLSFAGSAPRWKASRAGWSCRMSPQAGAYPLVCGDVDSEGVAVRPVVVVVVFDGAQRDPLLVGDVRSSGDRLRTAPGHGSSDIWAKRDRTE